MNRQACKHQHGFAAAQHGFAAEQHGFAAEQHGFAAAQRGFAAAQRGFAAVLLHAALVTSLLTGCSPEPEPTPVDVELHMMSRCPFGGALLQELAQTQAHLGERMALRIHYIGTTTETGFKTMYGPQDVQGDQVQLCAKQVGDTQSWLRFLTCQQREPELIPNNWPDCAKESGIDPAKLSACADSPLAARLLKSSFALSASRKIKSSPTLLIGGKKHEGGRLSYHLDRALCAAMAAPKHDYCADMDGLPDLTVTIVADPKCTRKDCDLSRFLQFAERNVPGAEIKTLEAGSDEGQALTQLSKAQVLPIAVFGPELVQRTRAFAKLKAHTTPLVDDGGFVFQIGKSESQTRQSPVQPPALDTAPSK